MGPECGEGLLFSVWDLSDRSRNLIKPLYFGFYIIAKANQPHGCNLESVLNKQNIPIIFKNKTLQAFQLKKAKISEGYFLGSKKLFFKFKNLTLCF